MAALIALALLNAAPAFAHAGLVSSDPADGSVLAAPPAQVLLEFNEVLLEDTVSTSIRDEADVVVSSGSAIADGASVSVPWPSDLPDGSYRLAYRVVSADGHPVTGEIGIVLNAAGDLTVEPQPAQAAGGLPVWLIGFLLIALIATAGIFVLARRSRR